MGIYFGPQTVFLLPKVSIPLSPKGTLVFLCKLKHGTGQGAGALKYDLWSCRDDSISPCE